MDASVLALGEMISPLATSVVPAIKGGIPGLSGISALLVRSISNGAANAFLTLRVGEVARRYCALTSRCSRDAIRKSATAAAVHHLGRIVREIGALVVRKIWEAARDSGVSMAATKFEFEKRFWIICAIYLVAFLLSVFDHTPLIVALRHLIAPSITRGSSDAGAFARIVILIGALFVFLSAALRTWGAAYLRTEVVHDTAQHSEALVADGPFRYTRNPLYLANLPMAAGIGVLASRWGFIFLVLANWIFVYRLIYREEESLLKTQGESYRVYFRAVQCFWPALRQCVLFVNILPV